MTFNVTELEALNTAARLASSLCQKLNDLSIPLRRHSIPPNVDTLLPDIELTIPPDIWDPISSLRIADDVRQSLMQRLQQFVKDIQRQYRISYRHSCLETIRGTNSLDDIAAVHRTYQILLQRQCIPVLRSQVDFILGEVAKFQNNNSEQKRYFNHEFTPILEKYFELNGYPSSAHRLILAQRSGMTARQIEVWFQNHRKRAKHDGKHVSRLDSDIPLKQALSLLAVNERSSSYQSTIPPSKSMELEPVVPRHTECRQLASCLEETEHTPRNDLIRPPHAFPTTRTADYPDPFPNDAGLYKFPKPVWRRKPAAKQIVPTEVDMDDFARQFHMRLNFVNTWKGESNSPNSEPPSFTPWFAPLRTIPPPAPLPALHRPAWTAVSTSMLSSIIAEDPLTFVFPQPRGLEEKEKSNVTCIVRLPVGPPQSEFSITRRIDRYVNALDQQCEEFRVYRPDFHSPRPSNSRLASSGQIAGRKGRRTSRRGPSSLPVFGSRTLSFTSDTSSSSDDSSSPSTPPPLPNNSLLSEPVIESDNFATNFDSFLQVPSSTSFDFTFSKSPSETQPLSPKPSDFTITNLVDSNDQPLSSRTFDFTFSKSVIDGQLSAFHQNHSPLIFT